MFNILNILKQAAPYVLLAVMALWGLSLQKEVTHLEHANAALSASVDRVSRMAEVNDRALVEWLEAHDAVTYRMEHIHEELEKVDDHLWGDMCLPDEYVRVLHEAGILDHRGPASGHTAPGSGDPKADRNH